MEVTTIEIDSNFIRSAEIHGKASGRSAIEQLEYWAAVGQLSQQGFTYDHIVEILSIHHFDDRRFEERKLKE